MARKKPHKLIPRITQEDAFRALETALNGPCRNRIVDHALHSGDLAGALRRLRSEMGSHTFQTGERPLELGPVIAKYDRRTRQEGIHVLHVWHHGAHRFLPGITPVLMLDYFGRLGFAAGSERGALAILLDYYFLHILILLATRIWDDGDPDIALQRVQSLLDELQGKHGSGFAFARSAESLLLLAISQYHPNEKAYDELLAKVRELDEAHRRELSIVMSAMLGSHLRWGFPALYDRDLTRMRDDNVVDYPWLLFSLSTLIRDYAAMRAGGLQGWQRQRTVEALINGMTADPSAFLGTLPGSLSEHQGEYAEFCSLLKECRRDLWGEFEGCRPTSTAYSPLNFRFNFPHNAMVGMIAVALLRGASGNLALDDLLSPGENREAMAEGSESLARALMIFSSRPERLDTRGQIQILYDPENGLENFKQTLAILA